MLYLTYNIGLRVKGVVNQIVSKDCFKILFRKNRENVVKPRKMTDSVVQWQ